MIYSIDSENTAETVAKAVSHSTRHTEIVTLLVPTADQFETARALLIERADDYVDVSAAEVDAWGADGDGSEWRVQARAEVVS